MFERFTEAARRLIFSARSEATQSGSAVIETEHFALALLNDEASLIRQVLPPDLAAAVEKDLRETISVNRSALHETNLPLSPATKRVLALGAEVADQLNHPRIDHHHLLLGLLKQADCPAVPIMTRHGITIARVLQAIGETDSAAIDGVKPEVTRESLLALVAALPESALPLAHRALTHLQTSIPRQVPPRIAELQNEMRERFRRSTGPGRGMVGGIGGSWSADPQGKVRDGSFSSGRIEDGARVTETHRFLEGHEITIVERLRIQEEKKQLFYSQEIHGPGREHRFEIDFDLP